jgi:hypothetical protein
MVVTCNEIIGCPENAKQLWCMLPVVALASQCLDGRLDRCLYIRLYSMSLPLPYCLFSSAAFLKYSLFRDILVRVTMTILPPEVVVALSLGLPTLAFAILTWWDTRRRVYQARGNGFLLEPPITC